MVLLHMLQKQQQLAVVVAHLDHGIRDDSAKDRELVQDYCTSHNIEFIYEEAQLGRRASEETARRARYDFLQRVCEKYGARAVITAHHQDDMLETAIINLIRGTGRRGLSALATHDQLIRPMLHLGKAEIVAYARSHGLIWHEDSTNEDQRYLRNYVRHQLVACLSEQTRQMFLSIIVRHSGLNTLIDRELDAWLSEHVAIRPLGPSDGFDSPITSGLGNPVRKEFFAKLVKPGMALAGARILRYDFIMLPQAVAYELLQQLFKHLTGATLQKPLAERALLFIKTARPHKRFLLGDRWQLCAHLREVIVEPRGNMLS